MGVSRGRPNKLVTDESGVRIELGSLVNNLMYAGAIGAITTIISVPTLTGVVMAQQDKIDAQSIEIKSNSRHIRDLEEGQRKIEREQKWTNKQLAAIVSKLNVNVAREDAR